MGKSINPIEFFSNLAKTRTPKKAKRSKRKAKYAILILVRFMTMFPLREAEFSCFDYYYLEKCYVNHINNHVTITIAKSRPFAVRELI